MWFFCVFKKGKRKWNLVEFKVFVFIIVFIIFYLEIKGRYDLEGWFVWSYVGNIRKRDLYSRLI